MKTNELKKADLLYIAEQMIKINQANSYNAHQYIKSMREYYETRIAELENNQKPNTLKLEEALKMVNEKWSKGMHVDGDGNKWKTKLEGEHGGRKKNFWFQVQSPRGKSEYAEKVRKGELGGREVTWLYTFFKNEKKEFVRNYIAVCVKGEITWFDNKKGENKKEKYENDVVTIG